MFVAARVAADVAADVALLDRPFAESMDENARAIVADVLGWLRGLRREYTVHRDRIDAGKRWELLERDVWKVGEWATPYVDYPNASTAQPTPWMPTNGKPQGNSLARTGQRLSSTSDVRGFRGS